MKYRVKMVESERGWGQEYFDMDFDTRQEAQEYLDKMTNQWESTYAQDNRAPDYYVIPADSKIFEVYDD